MHFGMFLMEQYFIYLSEFDNATVLPAPQLDDIDSAR